MPFISLEDPMPQCSFGFVSKRTQKHFASLPLKCSCDGQIVPGKHSRFSEITSGLLWTPALGRRSTWWAACSGGLGGGWWLHRRRRCYGTSPVCQLPSRQGEGLRPQPELRRGALALLGQVCETRADRERGSLQASTPFYLQKQSREGLLVTEG